MKAGAGKAKKVVNIAFRAVEVALALVVIALVIFGLNFGKRPRPSEERYISTYMEFFDSSQIEKIEYDYEGAIGGAATVAKVQFKGPIKTGVALEEKIKDGKVVVGFIGPVKKNSPEEKELKRQWTLWDRRGSVPSWLDYPYDRKLRTLEENFDGDKEPYKPPHTHKWYIDDERNIVYFFGVWS